MSILVKHLGLLAYSPVLERMRAFTEARDPETLDEIWLLEHEPVFTQGQAGRPEHVIHPGHIPVIQSDRGGQVTYHGPGQLIGYCLIDMERRHWHVRDLVCFAEQLLIQVLEHYGIKAQAKREAPGVYVGEAKIASLGFRIKRGCSYHGFALNVNMDLAPFARIHPCGFANQVMTSLQAEGVEVTVIEVVESLKKKLIL